MEHQLTSKDCIEILNNKINRQNIVNSLNKVIKNKKKSSDLENGIFDYTVSYATNNKLSELITSSVYMDKYYDILDNIDGKNNTINNAYLKKHIDDTNNVKNIAYYAPYEINPDKWSYLLYKKEQSNKQTHSTNHVSRAYTCKKCHNSEKFKEYQMQTRSMDEPITNFVVCLSCGNTFKY